MVSGHGQLPSRRLGAELVVSCIGLGCMGMSGVYGDADEADSVTTIQTALDRGVTFLDTSDIYGAGHNEELVGRAIRGRREDVVLATKFGQVAGGDGRAAGVAGDAGYVRQACERSLTRLGVDTIDLLYQHRVDPDVPVEETFGAMGELVDAGKVRYLGICEAAPETIRRAHATRPLAAVQTEYSLWWRDPETDLLPTCRELGIGYVAYSPLGRGLLGGRIGTVDDLSVADGRRRHPRFQGDAFDQNLRLVGRLRELARERGCTLSQLAIAWLLTRGDDIVPIPGTKRPSYLEENLVAAELTLSDTDLAHIEQVAPPNAGAGLRYPEPALKRVML